MHIFSSLVALSVVARSLGRAKVLLATAVVTATLGIWATTVAFALFDGILFRPLPFNEPGRLVQVQSRLEGAGGPFLDGAATLNLAVTQVLADHKDLFSGVAWANGGSPQTVALGLQDSGVLSLTAATYGILDVLGVRPIIGPGFAAQGGYPPDERPVLLGYEVWQSRYRASPDVLSLAWNTIEMRQGASSTIRWRVVGVLPKDFVLPSSNPLTAVADGIFGIDAGLSRSFPPSQVGIAPFARLAEGVSLSVARQRVNAIVTSIFGRSPQIGDISVVPLAAGMLTRSRPYAWLAMIGSWAILVATCLTLTMLLLTWSHSRRREAGIRLALGASPRELLMMSLLESLFICVLGAVVGWAAYLWVRPLLAAVMPAGLHMFATSAIDTRVVVATCAATLLCALGAGAIPAVRTSRTTPLDVLRVAHGGTVTERLLGGSVLLAAQAAFGVVLLVGACATIPAAIHLLLQSPGYEPNGLFTVRVPASVNDPDQRRLQVEANHAMRVLEVVRALPGVTSANVSTSDPFETTSSSTSSHASRGFWSSRGLKGRELGVDRDFFRTLQNATVAGRTFSTNGDDQRASEAILNESAVRVLWPDSTALSAIGRTIDTHNSRRVIVGVVADIRAGAELNSYPDLFVPILDLDTYDGNELSVVIRMSPGAAPDRRLFWSTLWSAGLAPPMSRTMIQSVIAPLTPTLERTRLLVTFFGVLGGITMALTTIAVYGLASFEVRRRKHDLTVRLALGATSGSLRRKLAAMTVRPVAVGVGIGLPIGWALTSFLGSWVPFVGSHGVPVYGGAAAALVLAGLLAAWVPSRRLSAMRVASLLRSS